MRDCISYIELARPVTGPWNVSPIKLSYYCFVLKGGGDFYLSEDETFFLFSFLGFFMPF